MQDVNEVLMGDGELRFTGAEVLALLGESIHRPELSQADRDLALRSIDGVIGACRHVYYPKTDILETILINGGVEERRLALCRDAVAYMGNDKLLTALWDASGEARS